jgi:prepilin-type N-terminal cleavage/methylation domain-containing protein
LHNDAQSAFQQNPIAIPGLGHCQSKPHKRHLICSKITDCSKPPFIDKASLTVVFPEIRSKQSGFTLVEMMIVVAVIVILAAIAVPSFLRARKRSQASLVKNDLRLIDSAIAQYAVDTNKQSGDPVEVDDWIDYVKESSNLYDTGQDILGHDYGDQIVNNLPTVPASTWDTLSDVADSAFWIPYTREGATPPPKHKTKKKKGH